jgi:hypothetical protein
MFGEDERKRLEHIISKQNDIIELLASKLPSLFNATKLSASYYTTDDEGNIIIHPSISQMQNISVGAGLNNLPGQLQPLAADNTPLDISSIKAGSEVYAVVDQATGLQSTIATVAPTPGGAEGQFTVSRIPGKSGVVLLTYAALAADGVTKITNVGGQPDVITFAASTAPSATQLSATFGQPTA